MATRILSLAGIAIGGCCFGTLYERWKRHNYKIPFIGYKIQAEDSCNFVNQKVLKRVTKLGMPKDYTDIFRDRYLIRYDHQTRCPRFVIEHVKKCGEKADDFSVEYQPDPLIPQMYQTKVEDFDDIESEKYELGQYAYANHHQESDEEMKRTFLLSNTVLLDPGTLLVWQRLEKLLTIHFLPNYREVYVISGPIYDYYRSKKDKKSYVKYQVVGKNDVAVPTHLFKVILGVMASGQADFDCFVVPNKELSGRERLTKFRKKIGEVQNLTSMTFLSAGDFASVKYSKDDVT